MAILTNEILEIFSNIISAVESGGQIYGNGRWNDYTPAYKNSSKETACTIGCYQRFAGEAKALLVRIRKDCPTVFSKLDTAGIGKDLDSANWTTYSPTAGSAKAKCIQSIIGSTEGIKIQKIMFGEDMQKYADQIEVKYGVKRIDALLHCCNIKHLGGDSGDNPPLKRIIGRISGTVTLDKVRDSLLKDTVRNQVGAEPYKSRQACVYKWLKEKVTPLLDSNGLVKGTTSTTTKGSEIPVNNTLQQAFHDNYKIILARNVYSQSLRDYVFKTYGGKYYSDCSSSICATMNRVGVSMSNLNTAGMYYSSIWKKVDVTISNGHISDVSKLRVGDALMFVGSDPSRPLQIGHVEAVYEINGTAESQITICGHGSGNPSTKNLNTYLSQRYAQVASNGKRKGLVCVLRAIPDTGSTSTTTTTTTRNYLQKGDSGTDVKTLQTNLIKLGFSCGTAGADGYFGNDTDKAVRAFQAKYGLTVDGQAGVNTQAKITALLSPITTSTTSTKKEWIKRLQKAIGATIDGIAGSETLSKCPTLKMGASGQVVELLQEYLGNFLKIGVTGGYDGIFSNGTGAAVAEAQRQYGLTIDKIVGKDTWKKILGI